MSSASKTRISSEEKLYASDKSMSVESGYAIATNANMRIDVDK